MELCANFAAQMSHGQAVLVEAKPNAHAEIVLESWGRNIFSKQGTLELSIALWAGITAGGFAAASICILC